MPSGWLTRSISSSSDVGTLSLRVGTQRAQGFMGSTGLQRPRVLARFLHKPYVEIVRSPTKKNMVLVVQGMG